MPETALSTDTKLNQFFRHFQMLGIIIGGIMPIMAFFLLAGIFGIEGAVILKGGCVVIGILTFVVLFLTLFLYHKEPRFSHKNWFSGFFTAQAILCFALTHFIIFYTGGAKSSVFSFTCLYIPSVVGYVYGKSNNRLIGAIFFMLVSYTMNLFFFPHYSTINPDRVIHLDYSRLNMPGPIKYEFTYLAIFLLQLYVLWDIASQKQELKMQNKKNE